MACMMFLAAFWWTGAEEVENGKTPVGSPQVLKLVEDLRIDPDPSQKHLQWKGGFAAISINTKGHIFVTDPGSEKVWHFDENGTFVDFINASFMNLASFQILADDTAISLENVQGPSRFTYFDASGKLLRRQRNTDSSKLLQHVRFSPEGQHMASVYFKVKLRGVDRKVESVFMDTDIKVLKTVTTHQLPAGDTSLPIREFWTNELGRHLNAGAQGLGKMAFADDGTIYAAKNDEYVITCMNPNLETQLVIRRDFDPIPFGDDQRKASVPLIRGLAHAVISPSHRRYVNDEVVLGAIEKAGLGTDKHPIFELVPLPNNHLLVFHNYDGRSRESKADLFNADGRFIGTTIFKGITLTHLWANPTRLIFKKDYAYALEEDTKGHLSLVRYKWRQESRN